MLTICPTLHRRSAGRKQRDERMDAEGLKAHIESMIWKTKSTEGHRAMVLRYQRWCDVEGQVAFPVSYDVLAGFLCSVVQGRHGSTKSLGAVLAAVRFKSDELHAKWVDAHEARRLRQLVSKMEELDTEPIRRKSALQLKHLAKMFEEKELTSPQDLEEVLLLYVGHDGLFRSGELLSGLKVSDVVWSSDRTRFTVALERSKANRKGNAEFVTVCDYEGVSAVKLMLKWFNAMGLWAKPDAVLFPSRRGKEWYWDRTISTTWLRRMIKRRAVKAGLTPDSFSGHSLRAGGATDLFVARVPYFLIKKMGRWRSDAAMLYYRSEEDVCLAVAAAFGLMSKPDGGVAWDIPI